MAQTVITTKTLLERLSAELKKHHVCDDCRFTGILALRETDSEGCNWSQPNLQCSGVPASACAPVANEIVSRFKRTFNVQR